FREWATIQAGFYDEYQMPDGSLRRVAKSISFASMDDSQFNGVYKSVLNVLWNYILRRKFHSRKDSKCFRSAISREREMPTEERYISAAFWSAAR
ncbi:DUF1367 family protein, partial [Klebsiella pneumoniae]|nr:DUF1367 family protein [Klebsiella pneumoniae]